MDLHTEEEIENPSVVFYFKTSIYSGRTKNFFLFVSQLHIPVFHKDVPDVVCVLHQVFKYGKKWGVHFIICKSSLICELAQSLKNNILIKKDHKMSLPENISERIPHKLVNEGISRHLNPF